MRSRQVEIQNSRRAEACATIEERLSDEARFLRTWFENPLRTGAVSPSGRFLARAMARCVDPEGDGVIVELGPGTGPVTQALIQRGVKPERLILVEYDPTFCRLLQRRFPKCRVVQGDAYDLRKTLPDLNEGQVAAVVSSLPLLTRPDRQRQKLLEQSFSLMRPDGCFIQFTYGMASPVPSRTREGRGCAFTASVSAPIWLNLPPARVWVYRPASEVSTYVERASGDLMIKLRERTGKVRDDFRETCEKIENRWKARAVIARRTIAIHTRRARDETSMKPAIALLRRISEPRKHGW